ncbi:MAG: hypothetical protein AB1555_01840 [Nitrospirota bacterium]
MKQESTLTARILEAVHKRLGCRIEELVSLFPDHTWNQVFREVNRLSRNRQLRLMLDGRGVFTVRRPDEVMALQSLAGLQGTQLKLTSCRRKRFTTFQPR